MAEDKDQKPPVGEPRRDKLKPVSAQTGNVCPPQPTQTPAQPASAPPTAPRTPTRPTPVKPKEQQASTRAAAQPTDDEADFDAKVVDDPEDNQSGMPPEGSAEELFEQTPAASSPTAPAAIPDPGSSPTGAPVVGTAAQPVVSPLAGEATGSQQSAPEAAATPEKVTVMPHTREAVADSARSNATISAAAAAQPSDDEVKRLKEEVQRKDEELRRKDVELGQTKKELKQKDEALRTSDNVACQTAERNKELRRLAANGQGQSAGATTGNEQPVKKGFFARWKEKQRAKAAEKQAQHDLEVQERLARAAQYRNMAPPPPSGGAPGSVPPVVVPPVVVNNSNNWIGSVLALVLIAFIAAMAIWVVKYQFLTHPGTPSAEDKRDDTKKAAPTPSVPGTPAAAATQPVPSITNAPVINVYAGGGSGGSGGSVNSTPNSVVPPIVKKHYVFPDLDYGEQTGVKPLLYNNEFCKINLVTTKRKRGDADSGMAWSTKPLPPDLLGGRFPGIYVVMNVPGTFIFDRPEEDWQGNEVGVATPIYGDLIMFVRPKAKLPPASEVPSDPRYNPTRR